jgi:signal transduction histidine kinase
MQKAKFITRILQEFIQNSMKYSKCSEIKIELHKKEDQLSILVQDNGIGFDLTETKDGIGLNNMKKRAEIIGAQYELNSNHHGTSLLLNLEI